MRRDGDRSSTEWTVLSSTDHASLWKQMITEVDGRLFWYRPDALHLEKKRDVIENDREFKLKEFARFEKLL